MGSRGTLIILFCLTAANLAGAVVAQPAKSPTAIVRATSALPVQLLGSARIWKMKNNLDRERADLLKLLAAEPNHAQALTMLGLLEIRADHIDVTTRLLKRLKAAHPDDAGVGQMEEALRIAGVDRKKMTQIQFLARFGKNDEAAAAMRLLFPNGSPGGDLVLTYYRVIGNTSMGWEEAHKGLETLVQKEPDDTRLQMALAVHLTHRAETRAAGMTALAKLAQHPDVDKQLVLDTWEHALVVLNRNPEHIPMYLAYIEADPKNFSIRDALSDAKRVEADRRPWLLRDTADTLLLAGRAGEAEAALKEALQLDPKNPWVRFDLSRLYHKRGSQKQGREVMEQGLVVAADLPDMVYAVALYVGLIDETEYALRLLNNIPLAVRTEAIHGFIKKMQIQLQAEQVQTLARSGRRVEALATLERAEVAAGDDMEIVNIVANAWFDLGDSLRGIARMSKLIAAQAAPSVASRLLYARLLNRARRSEELASLLDKLSSSGELSNNDQEDFRFLRASLAAHQADDRRNAGDYAGARAVLAPALDKDPDNTDMLMALARVHTATREPDKARVVYQRVLTRMPNNPGVRLALARTMSDGGDKTAARREVELILTNAALDDIDTRMAIADVFIEMNDIAAARRIIDQSRKTAPDHSRVLIAAGRLARAEGRPEEAMVYFRQAKADDEVARMERERKKMVVTSGVDSLSKSGTPGISNLKATELPVEMRFPVGYVGQAFVHVDTVRVSAGDLQLDDLDNLRKFGKILALAPGGIASAPVQSARGTALAVGYEIDDMRFDIGTTPLGFPVTDVVGGFKLYRSAAPFFYSYEIARRPMTSSVLSYAGMRDPVSGQVWGGVRSNGVNWHMGYEGDRFDAFTDVGYYLLTGKNVASNNEFALRTGLEWKLLQKDDTRFSVSFVATHWRYQKNLSNYTFGHGGYYSPQSYYSLALQPRWTGRIGRWSYLLNGSVSASVSREKDMPYYPTDQALQTAANSIYTGGPGHGTGYSVGGALEYQMAPRLFIGGRFGVDRSAYYTPNFAGFYLRYVFDGHSGSVPYPPDPVRPYSRF